MPQNEHHNFNFTIHLKRKKKKTLYIVSPDWIQILFPPGLCALTRVDLGRSSLKLLMWPVPVSVLPRGEPDME